MSDIYQYFCPHNLITFDCLTFYNLIPSKEIIFRSINLSLTIWLRLCTMNFLADVWSTHNPIFYDLIAYVILLSDQTSCTIFNLVFDNCIIKPVNQIEIVSSYPWVWVQPSLAWSVSLVLQEQSLLADGDNHVNTGCLHLLGTSNNDAMRTVLLHSLATSKTAKSIFENNQKIVI